MLWPSQERSRFGLPAASVFLASCLLLWSATAATASTITLGPNLNGASSGTKLACVVAGGCTYAQSSPGYVSPISGVIVRWRLIESTGTFTLRVIHGNVGGASGPTGTAASTGLQEFPAALPIKAGDEIALDLPGNATSLVAFNNFDGASIGYWNPSLAEGETRSPKSVTTGFQLFNADVQPPPGITALTPASGPIKVANSVVIGGHDFNGASAVKFGSLPATRFSLDSDTQITAVAPPSPGRASVPVSVTTIAGTATSPKSFDYQACVVPKLKGKKLKAAKKKTKAADCRLGKVSKRDGAGAKTGKVVKQSPKAGKVLSPGTKVRVVLGK
jgi:hypothetical protein